MEGTYHTGPAAVESTPNDCMPHFIDWEDEAVALVKVSIFKSATLRLILMHSLSIPQNLRNGQYRRPSHWTVTQKAAFFSLVTR